MRRLLSTIITLGFLLIPPACLADLTIKLKLREGTPTEHYMTLRFKGRRQRNDFEDVPAGKFAWLFQCDQKKVIGINFSERRSFIHPMGMTLNASMAFNETQSHPAAPSAVHAGGKLTQTVVVTDTGERRELFGFQARRIKTTTTWVAEPACEQNNLRAETDGWYVDLLYGVECSADLSGFWNQPYVAPRSKCEERFSKNHYEFQSEQVGAARFGFPLMLTRTFYGDQGKPVINQQEVVELSTAELDSALFEVPLDFAQKSFSAVDTNRPSVIGRMFSFIHRR